MKPVHPCEVALLTTLNLLAACLPACDGREAFRAPEPGLQRMLSQRRGNPYGASQFFADQRVMQTPPPFTRARDGAELDTSMETGREDGRYLLDLPVPRTRELLERGRTQFELVCATCHGMLGDGVSVVAQKMELREPPSLHEARLVALPRGRLFEIISQGYGLMPSLSAQIATRDRWAIVAYVDALRLSRAAPIGGLPEELRAELQRGAP